MANSFGGDILIQAEDPSVAADFYVRQLGFTVMETDPQMMSLKGERINLYIEQGPVLGAVLEVFVTDVEAAKARLLANGCVVVRDEPEVPRCYVRDPYGLIYNVAAKR